MRTTMRGAGLLAMGAALLASAAPAAAQDLEAAARATGRQLPPGYYERVRQQPDFFEIDRGWTRRARTVQPGAPLQVTAVSGNLPTVVVMALFSDSPEPRYPAEVTAQRLFGDNPDGNLTQFYREVSGNRLNVTGTVLPWVRTRLSRAEVVGAQYGLGGDARVGQYLVDALTRVDASTDFGRFDNDGGDGVPNSGDDDGFVDAAIFQFVERSAACDGNGIWPHRSTIRGWLNAPFATNERTPAGQPIRVDDYIIQSALDCAGAEPQSISTIAHEMGHILGLPDFYDATGGILPSQRRWVLGCFTLMAAGSWGCGNPQGRTEVPRPSHMGPYEKAYLGWLQEQQAGEGWNLEYMLDPIQTSGQSLRIPLGNTEYLQVEYRPNTGFNAGLPASGVLVYHVDPQRALRPCATCPRLYRVMLVEADGDGALLRTAGEAGNRGIAADMFTGTRLVSDATFPLLRRHDGTRTGLSMKIEVLGAQARILLSTEPLIETVRLLAPFLGAQNGPTAAEAQVLDGAGNANGRYDLGDLRAYLRANPAS